MTALVKSDGSIKILRMNRETWKSTGWLGGLYFDNKPYTTLIERFTCDDWSLIADVKPPKDWWYEAGTAWRSLPPSTPHDEFVRFTQDAYAKAREGWAEYLRRLQVLYPVFTAIEDAPDGANVPLRMIAAAQPQQQQLLMPPPRTTEYERQQQKTITLTRDQLDEIIALAYGKPLSDDQWLIAIDNFATKA